MLKISEGEHLFCVDGKFYHALDVDKLREDDKPLVCWRLKGLIAEHDMTVKELAQRIGISENSLRLRINGRREWLYKELIATINLFGFSETKDVFPDLHNSILM